MIAPMKDQKLMLRLPLGHFSVPVWAVPDLADDEGDSCAGMSCTGTNQIWVDAALLTDSRLFWSTVAHGSLHLIGAVCGIRLSERDVRCLECGVMQMLWPLVGGSKDGKLSPQPLQEEPR